MVTVKDLKEYLKSHNLGDDTTLCRASVVGTTKTKLETSGFTGIGMSGNDVVVLWTNANCCAAQEIWKKKYPFKDYIN